MKRFRQLLILHIGIIIIISNFSLCSGERNLKLPFDNARIQIKNVCQKNITKKGFKFTKRNIEAKYVIVKKILSISDYSNPFFNEIVNINFQITNDMNKDAEDIKLANKVYQKLIEAAGGLEENEILINLLIQSTMFLKNDNTGNEVTLEINVYADKIKFDKPIERDDNKKITMANISNINESIIYQTNVNRENI